MRARKSRSFRATAFRGGLAGAGRLARRQFGYHAATNHVAHRYAKKKNKRITWRRTADVKVRRAAVKCVVFAEKVTARAQNLGTAVA